MNDSIRLFGWFFTLSIFITLFRFWSGPLPLLLFVTPIFALFQLILTEGFLSSKPHSYWLFKVPGLWRLRNTLSAALALPIWVRLVIILSCMFGGGGLAMLSS